MRTEKSTTALGKGGSLDHDKKLKPTYVLCHSVTVPGTQIGLKTQFNSLIKHKIDFFFTVSFHYVIKIQHLFTNDRNDRV